MEHHRLIGQSPSMPTVRLAKPIQNQGGASWTESFKGQSRQLDANVRMEINHAAEVVYTVWTCPAAWPNTSQQVVCRWDVQSGGQWRTYNVGKPYLSTPMGLPISRVVSVTDGGCQSGTTTVTRSYSAWPDSRAASNGAPQAWHSAGADSTSYVPHPFGCTW